MFVLHDIQGYGHGEIAELLGCSIGNSKSQLHKARLRMRELLTRRIRRGRRRSGHGPSKSLGPPLASSRARERGLSGQSAALA
jgi:Sigma-70, region 4